MKSVFDTVGYEASVLKLLALFDVWLTAPGPQMNCMP